MLFGKKNDYENFKKFILENSIIGTAAGVTIGVASKDLVLSLSSDIMVPSIILLLYWLNIKSLKRYLPSGKTKIDFEKFFKNLLSWLIVLIATFAFVIITFHHLLGVKIIRDDNDGGKHSELKK